LNIVWLAGLVVTVLLLFTPSTSSSNVSLNYSDWKGKVDANQVKTAVIDTSGRVTGQLTDNRTYSSRIPTAVPDQGLASDLAAHNVKVTATSPTTSIWSIIGGLLPFVLLLGVYFWISRRASRQLAGGLMGIGSSRAKVYDQERPTTRFADVAGYEGAKREISEVVDFLKNPQR
jgi:cell division protease FtsH